jgi:hypothetical protein
MANQHTREDFEREPRKEYIYLYEKETEQWLWWHNQWQQEEGIIEMEGIEEEEELIL